MKSPITAEMTMALMPCLLISTSAITWPAEHLPPDNNAFVVDEGKDTTIGSMCKAKIELLVAFLGFKKTPSGCLLVWGEVTDYFFKSFMMSKTSFFRWSIS